MAHSIVVKNLWKKYSIGQPNKLTDLLPQLLSGKKVKQFWALKKISFEIREGARVGIVGKNGSGKSTLLKILAGVTQATKGSCQITNKASALLDLGSGFHPDLTGEENIYLYGSILGLKHQQVQKQFNHIVNFSGIKRFIKSPVKYYSSGMYVRLAFSVIINLNPQTLLLDEVLSVGDISFRKKSMAKIKEIVNKNQTTVLLVSHDHEQIAEFCQKAIWLDKGKLLEIGPAKNVVNHYLASYSKNSSSSL